MQLQPMPLFLNESAERGLICGPSGAGVGRDSRGRWLPEATFVPAALREVLLEHDDNRRIKPADGRRARGNALLFWRRLL
jgi:hypothetical protein